MVSRDLVPMPEGCASWAGMGKPLELAAVGERNARARVGATFALKIMNDDEGYSRPGSKIAPRPSQPSPRCSALSLRPYRVCWVLRGRGEVRFALLSGHARHAWSCPLWASTGHSGYLVCASVRDLIRATRFAEILSQQLRVGLLAPRAPDQLNCAPRSEY